MAILKYINRLKQMDRLIRTKASGTPEQFAKKVGVSRSTLMEYLSEMKALGAQISYCKYRQCYGYKQETSLEIGFSSNLLSSEEKGSVVGGQNYFQEISPVRIYRTVPSYLPSAFAHAH